jgi:outer membrane protein assembly factor BamB
MNDTPARSQRGSIRWWPAAAILLITAAALVAIRSRSETAFQQRNLLTTYVLLSSGALILVWWLFFSRIRWRTRFLAFGGLVVAGVLAGFSFRITGVTGDLIPIFEPRWSRAGTDAKKVALPQKTTRLPGDFPQFLGPDRNGILPGPRLATNWAANPPQELWRVPVGPGWSGFAVAGDRAITQEQDGENELVVCRDLVTGVEQWRSTNPGHYANTIAGEGPRTTPSIVGDKVFTLGSTGWLQCLDIATGRPLWATNLLDVAKCSVPAWGFAGSPLVKDGRLIISAGGADGRSLLIFDANTGRLAGSGGSSPANYGSPFFAILAGVPQVIIFNEQDISSHHPSSGELLWQRPWGTKYPLVAMPIQVDANRILVSAGYGVGAELIEVGKDAAGKLSPSTVWSSKRMKAKFANPVMRDGFVYGLDDGILACLDLKDGSQRWKEGRYGHGQGLWIGELFLLMTETGELTLLNLTPDGPSKLASHPVFSSKTWNPITLAGDLLLVRNDQQASCLRLAVR